MTDLKTKGDVWKVNGVSVSVPSRVGTKTVVGEATLIRSATDTVRIIGKLASLDAKSGTVTTVILHTDDIREDSTKTVKAGHRFGTMKYTFDGGSNGLTVRYQSSTPSGMTFSSSSLAAAAKGRTSHSS